MKRSREQPTRPSSPIGSEGPLNFLLAACQRAEEEEAAEHEKISESNSEIAENEVFIGTIIPSDDSSSERDDTDIEDEADDWEDGNTGEQEHNPETGASWIRSGESLRAKNKLIRILEGDALIPKQRWSLGKLWLHWCTTAKTKSFVHTFVNSALLLIKQ